MKDKRYTIQREWCGYSTPRWVVRFCDRWVGQRETRREARSLAREHKAGRDAILEGRAA